MILLTTDETPKKATRDANIGTIPLLGASTDGHERGLRRGQLSPRPHHRLGDFFPFDDGDGGFNFPTLKRRYRLEGPLFFKLIRPIKGPTPAAQEAIQRHTRIQRGTEPFIKMGEVITAVPLNDARP